MFTRSKSARQGRKVSRLLNLMPAKSAGCCWIAKPPGLRDGQIIIHQCGYIDIQPAPDPRRRWWGPGDRGRGMRCTCVYFAVKSILAGHRPAAGEPSLTEVRW